MRSKSNIRRVWIEARPDDYGDCSALGQFTDTPEEGAIVRSVGEYLANMKGEACERCKGGTVNPDDCEPGDVCPDCDGKGYMPYVAPASREYRYFVPAMSSDETGNPDSPMQDWKRAEGYGNEWSYMGIIAKAEIVVAGVCQTVRSAGLWGVESDSGDDYIYDEVGKDELAQLREVLESLGFGKAAISLAFKHVEHK